MTNYAAYHAGTAPAGGHVWINGGAYACAPPRGHVAVADDGSTYFYRVSRRERGAFKRWAADVFSGPNCKRLRGAWPRYEVVS